MNDFEIGDKVEYFGSSFYIPVGSIGTIKARSKKSINILIVIFPKSTNKTYRYGVPVASRYIRKVEEVK